MLHFITMCSCWDIVLQNPTYLLTYLCTYILTYFCTHLHTYVLTYAFTYILTYSHTHAYLIDVSTHLIVYISPSNQFMFSTFLDVMVLPNNQQPKWYWLLRIKSRSLLDTPILDSTFLVYLVSDQMNKVHIHQPNSCVHHNDEVHSLGFLRHTDDIHLKHLPEPSRWFTIFLRILLQCSIVLQDLLQQEKQSVILLMQAAMGCKKLLPVM